MEPGTVKGVGQAQGTELGAVEQSGAPPDVNVPPNTGEGELLLDSVPSRPTMSRQDVYARPMRAGRPLTNGPLTRLATWLKMSPPSGEVRQHLLSGRDSVAAPRRRTRMSGGTAPGMPRKRPIIGTLGGRVPKNP